jgi:hypothetical protein
MALTHLTETELAETVQRAREIADHSRELASPEAEYDAYLHAAEEMGIPREAMLQAIRERRVIPGETLEVGQRVFAPSADGFWYVAELLSLTEHTAKVRFLEGGEHTCATSDVRPLSLIPGRKLQGDIKGWGWYGCLVVRHDPAKDRVEVIHDDWAPSKEWLTMRKLRLTRDHVYPNRPKEKSAAEFTRGVLLRSVGVATAAGVLAGMVLHHLFPWLLPFLR